MKTSTEFAAELGITVEELFRASEDGMGMLELIRPVQHDEAGYVVYHVYPGSEDVIRRAAEARAEHRRVWSIVYPSTPEHLRDDVPDMFAGW